MFCLKIPIMKKIVYLFLFVSTLSTSQESIPLIPLAESTLPQNLVGLWRNGDNEFLIVQASGTFIRTDAQRNALAVGQISLTENEIQVVRTDVEDQYALQYYLGNETFSVSKPRSEQAWLFFKVGN